MSDLFEADDASTPLTPEEQQDLLLTYIANRAELNEAEQQNILAAQGWLLKRRSLNLFSETFLKQLHRQMFGQVWAWAGRYRTTLRNIGVDPWQIAPKMRVFLDDARYWVEYSTYAPDVLAVRFHHRLVLIHPFANGNGHISRLMADLLVVQLGQERFSWGKPNLIALSDMRGRYIEALRAADNGNLEALLQFARA